ncbi:hypothetical protein [Nonomuraea jiangxiensis]|uniref:Capsular polysaccharide biosynthesis protein n=1 Tax=Nonomuraea jiangxiensis TaxID=633440 RepID=A0A1G8MF35_9ACTN|nr:hypothetical protein [Nonomuraea jiangxiensis]SDI66445.1 hypothetical protein SAMN05421869_106392 [Nonomuraea jiangxiensis]
MDFWGTVLVVFRRWYVTVPAFLLALAAAYGVYQTIPVIYQSNAVLVLTIPPTGGSVPVDPKYPNPRTNPLLNYDGALNVSASILLQVLSAPETAAQLGAPPGGETTYTVNNGSANPELLASGPFVIIEARSPSAEVAHTLVTKLVERAKAEMAARQSLLKAPRSTFIQLTDMVAPTTPQEQRGGKSRSAAAVLALGLFACLTAGFATESLAAALRRRRLSRQAAPTRDTEADPASEAGAEGLVLRP